MAAGHAEPASPSASGPHPVERSEPESGDEVRVAASSTLESVYFPKKEAFKFSEAVAL